MFSKLSILKEHFSEATNTQRARFRRTKPDKVQPLLDTLTALALLRETDEGGYVG